MPTETAATERPLTISEVAAILHVSPSTVRRWTDAGHLTAHRTLGGQRRYRRADVEALRQAP